MTRLRDGRTYDFVAASLVSCGAAFWMVVLLLATSFAGPATAASHRDRWPSTRYASLLARADSLRWVGGNRVRAYLDSLIGAARARGDADLEMVAAVRIASMRAFVEGAFDEAVAESRRWLPPIRAAEDTLTWSVALRTIGFCDLVRERYSSSLVTYRQMLDLTVRARLDVPEGYARIGCSFIAIQQGRHVEAERGYRIAIRKLEGRDGYGTRVAWAGLGNALIHQGRPDDSRRAYERVVAESRAAGDPWNEADALNDLGEIEILYGDPSQAAALYSASAQLQRRLGRPRLALRSALNASDCLGAMGRTDEQAALIDSVARAAESLGADDLTTMALTYLAAARRGQRRLGEADSLIRRAATWKDSVSVSASAAVDAEQARIQIEQGRPAAAARTANEALETLGSSGGPADRVTLLYTLGLAHLASGDPAAAVAPLRENVTLLARSGGALGAFAIAAETQLARAFSALGRRDSALVHYGRAAGAWERLRATPNDPRWRETFDNLSRDLYGPYAGALLDPARGGTVQSRGIETFAMLQRFRSRTLEDVLRGAEGRVELPRVSLASLQRTLHPGEVLLDVFTSPDTTYLFAVTRDAFHLAGTAGAKQLTPRLGRFRDIVASGESDTATVAAAAAALGADLLGPVAASLRGSSTVLISAGSLSAFPLGMLRLPGEPEPIATRRAFAIVPSATLLAAARRARSSEPSRSGLLALSRTTDGKGIRLEGVARESRWLAQRFPGARVRANDGNRALDSMLDSLGLGAVLHIASHTRAPAAAPWRAGFLLGRGDGEDAYLTASRITRLRAPARVCVLASCTSAGTATGAEGLPNLAAAWLEAGARTVVATQWEVGDRATAKFVEDFYAALARGATTGDAMATAQQAARSSPDRNAARFWVGFVLIGDPTTRVTLGAAH